MNITLEKIRRIHQGLMDSLEGILDFTHPQLLLEFTALFLFCLTKLFFAQESIMQEIYISGVPLILTSVWIILLVYGYCFITQKVKDQVSMLSFPLLYGGDV